MEMSDILRGALESMRGGMNSTGTTVSHAEQVRMLEEAVLPECPFEVGTWVTPKDEEKLKGAGDPHRVVSVMPAQFDQRGTPGGPMRLINMIVSTVVQDEVTYYLADSRDYERWYAS
jgi:hypothetical protein